tara:strand:+ start:3329 stop:4750 length:1422 start_codon:yes stop_codon:yes gene_type:complete
MALPYQGGSFNRVADYNFVTTMDLHKPEIESELTQTFGNQMLTGMLSMIGAEKGVSALEYTHYEEERIYPKLYATSAGAGAGAQATFTMAASSKYDVPEFASPYDGSTTTSITIPRRGELILIKPASGIVSADRYIKAIIDEVTATTFKASPLDSGDSVPAIGSAQEIVIYGNAYGEGSMQPGARQTKVKKEINQIQTVKGTYEVTSTERDMLSWVDFVGKDGKAGKMYYLKGEADEYKNFMSQKELTLLLGEKLNNDTVANAWVASGDANSGPISLTEGLIPGILSKGNTSAYSEATGWDKQDAESLVKVLDKQKGSKNNLLAPGIDLSIAIDNTLASYKTAGAITYGNYTFSEEASVNFQFDKFKIDDYIFSKKKFDSFNDLQTLGADGFGFTNEGLVIPMDQTRDAGTGEKTNHLRLRYLVNPATGERNQRSEIIDNYKITGKDTYSVFYKDNVGLESFCLNKFAYIKQG